ncbi:MAG: hypothetical protein ABL999_13425 [Pyrinomonadaceae bacterium]
MRKPLIDRIKKYVTLEAPLGPPDAFQIKDDEVAAHLFDPHNKSFNALLRKEISIVIGRRGAGKTALLNSYRYNRFLSMDSLLRTNSAGVDLKRYQIVIEVTTHTQFTELRKLATGVTGYARPIEAVIEDWSLHILDFFLASLYESASRRGPGQKYLLQIANYLYQDEEIDHYDDIDRLNDSAEKIAQTLVYGTELNGDTSLKAARRKVWGDTLFYQIFDRVRAIFASDSEANDHITQATAMEAAKRYLEEVNKRAILIFDSMDEYEVGNDIFDRTIGALLRFTASFNSTSDRIKIKLGLPSEIVHEIRRASTNPLKDFVNYDLVQWTSTELLQIAAFRYRLFLQLYEPKLALKLDKHDLYKRDDVWAFWASFFPPVHKNLYGTDEDVTSYILRHTQLLPRQLFTILERIVVLNNVKHGGYSQFKDDVVVAAVEEMESKIALEIFGAFKHVYSEAERVGKAIFAGFETVFEYEDLEKQWNRTSRHFSLHKHNSNNEMIDLITMFLRMGIVGVVEEEDNRYVIGSFYYNALSPPNIGRGNQLCLHPIFSKDFNAKLNSIGKAILPRGTTIDVREKND